MTPRTCVSSKCAELNPPDATHCGTCGKRLLPADRYQRVRGAIKHTSRSVNADAHARLIVNEIEKAIDANRHPSALRRLKGDQ